MSRRKYIEISLMEGVLLSILSICLTVSLAEGFYIPEEWSGRIMPAFLSCTAVCAYWILLTYNKKTSIAGLLIFTVMLFTVTVFLVRADENLEKKLLFTIIASLSATLLFVFSRTRIGTAGLIAAGSIVICGNAFLQYGSHPKLLCLYLPAAVLLLVERNYRINIRNSSTREPSVLRHTAAGLICCILALFLSGLAMALVIPAQLPTHELRLVKELVRMPIMEKIGTATTIPLDDKDQYTKERNGDRNPTSREGKHITEQNRSEKNQDAEPLTGKDEQEIINGGEEHGLRAIRYGLFKPIWVLFPFLVVFLSLMAVLLKKKQRRIRQMRFDRLDAKKSAAAYYQYFLHMLSLIRLEDNTSETVREYVRKTKRRTEVLFPGRGEFARISRDFERICYGEEAFDDETRLRFQSAYQRLPSLCCKNTGKIRYLFLFFRT